MYGLTSEPESRLGLSPVNFSSAPGALMTRGWPHQVGLAEVLPRRVRNLLGPQSSVASTSASGGASLASSLVVFMMMFFTTLLLVLRWVPTAVPTSAKMTKVTGSFPLVATKKKKKKHSKSNLPSECLVTAVQRLVLLVPANELQPSA